MARAYGAEIGPIGMMPLGEMADPPSFDLPEFSPGFKQERGFKVVEICEEHPLFEGFEGRGEFFQAHYWEVKGVPDGFEVLARNVVNAPNDLGTIQAMGHVERPLMGVQFHPTIHNVEFPDGGRLLENFFRHYVNGNGA
jgi:GMP synthase-like glutamine amidotransferase